MKKYELLSPAGDIENFYTAIKSGANAVYMGLPKFNARMKADNITLEILPKLINYAHAKNVKVYITLNTLVTDKELIELVDMVGCCLESNVDAFIVQDLGVIYLLKSMYPDIVLHGSTQLGVHNIRGAKVCKGLGLDRVVLSRECTIDDIEEIANNVDIELEVFVQGAMCICFSGNCYMSSLKHNASGNRGECKQLCRLPYKLSDGQKNLTGYALSPRDNCMLEYMNRLCSIGVTSFKIEGRLRHSGYVAIATNVYREAIESIINNKSFDINYAKDKLSRVFSRGEFVAGYNESNNVVDAINNNHMGACIGKCVSCKPFKNIYRIVLDLFTPIVQNDGLKFIHNEHAYSMGVGNIEHDGKYTIVYGKNNIPNGSIVYKTLDYELENNIIDYSSKTPIRIKCRALVGQELRVEYTIGDKVIQVTGDACEPARSQPMTKESIAKQLVKVDKDLYEVVDVDIICDDVFIAVSKLNELRRQVFEKLNNKIDVCRNGYPEIFNSYITYKKLAMVNENTNIDSIVSEYQGCIFSPLEYSIDTISKFDRVYRKSFDTPLIINLPIIARKQDINVIDKIVEKFKSENTVFIANNIYALDYIKVGARVWAGSGLNVVNKYSVSQLIKLGVEEIIMSQELWCGAIKDAYKLTGNKVLMTFTSCPFKTLNSNDCNSCKYTPKLSLTSGKNVYAIRRYKLASCYFELIDNYSTPSTSSHVIVDLRK